MKVSGILAGALAGAVLLAGCGTTYVLPEIDGASASRAQSMFAEAQQVARPAPKSRNAALQRYRRVVARVGPVGEALCLRETAGLSGFDCHVDIGIDTEMNERNAYFTYGDHARKRNPMIRVTLPMIHDVQNDHELAFILGHEYGHLIARHAQKKEQQAVAGALILGILSAAAAADNPYADPNMVSDNVELGYALGHQAFSQDYELESDTLGTLIARSAGYDPVIGACYFARGEAAHVQDQRLSFWGTHPPDEQRLATVIAVDRQIETAGGIGRKASH